MNRISKIYDDKLISTFTSIKDFFNRKMDIGQREVILALDRKTLDEIKNYLYKAEMYDDVKKDYEINKEELYKYEIQNKKLQDEIIRLKMKTGEKIYD